jgi:hypothetical protein
MRAKTIEVCEMASRFRGNDCDMEGPRGKDAWTERPGILTEWYRLRTMKASGQTVSEKAVPTPVLE